MGLSTELLRGYGKLRELLSLAKQGEDPVVSGLSDTQLRHVCHALLHESGKKGVYIAWNEMQARKALEDFQHFMPEGVAYLPNREVMLYDVSARSFEQTFDRVRALERLLQGDYALLVTSAEAVLHLLTPPQAYREMTLTLTCDMEMPMDALMARLLEMGYEREEKVEGRGQFAVRGGILDLFAIGAELPCRIEFFDIAIDSMRFFSPESQRSVERAQQLVVHPAREVLYARAVIPGITARLSEDLTRAAARLPAEEAGTLRRNIQGYMDKLSDSHWFTGADKFIPYMLKEPATIFDYVGGEGLVFLEDPARMETRMENEREDHFRLCETLTEKGMLLPGSFDLHHDPQTLHASMSQCQVISFQPFDRVDDATPGLSILGRPATAVHIPGLTLAPYAGHLDLLFEDIRKWTERGMRTVVLASSEDRVRRLAEELTQAGADVLAKPDVTWSDAAVAVTDVFGQRAVRHGQDPFGGHAVLVALGALQSGFQYPDLQLSVVCENDIEAGRARRARPRRGPQGQKIAAFTDLKPGDYVVHQTHGIGSYRGLEQLTVEGVRRDYLKIAYKDGGSLFIPTTSMDLIQKYIGSEGREPRLNKLGGQEWGKAKARVRESLKELAGQLIALQAQRQAREGHAFSPDTAWQRQFEDLFPFDETPDQLKCIQEIKKDMEAPTVMDRLLCGDVGYGKTEVALRAVFKAVMDGRQVAFLVPTTVLAAQHFENFRRRFAGFPVQVEMLSRFRTDSEHRQVLRNLRSGKTDVVVGTHMMLGKSVQFKDLGLLVIDEEQRFGVEHKETIKLRYPNVDLLTLSATPIPRTLNMSLSGLREISTIEDPPLERYPVQTYVVEYRDDIVQDAISRELARSGQVFYLYNRVRGIQSRVAAIQKLVPDARVAHAHGQMGERELERVVNAFEEKDIDVLVCTTIIESGIDMPNVNTIVVEDSDRLGLAQLYQLRGRVGRSNRLAYAYLTYRQDKVLNEVAEKRLKAIREFTEFGSGFKIAMRDLQIRGAGNLLGAEQHGHLETVGYDMYLRLLEEAVEEMRGEKRAQRVTDVTVEFPASAYLDGKYIPDEEQRVDMYQTIAVIQSETDLQDVRDELIDRYGDIPPETLRLTTIALIRNLAAACGISSVKDRGELVELTFADGFALPLETIGSLMGQWKGRLLFSAGRHPYLSLKAREWDMETRLENIKILLQGLHKLKS
jgi:transcription-repair coupling factor (superfamily II helicase)